MILNPAEEEGRCRRQPPHATQQAHCRCPPLSVIAVVLPQACRFGSGIHRQIATIDPPPPLLPPRPGIVVAVVVVDGDGVVIVVATNW